MKYLLFAIQILLSLNSFCQAIEGLPIDKDSEKILKDVMKASGVTEVVVTSTHRSVRKQVDVMYNYIIRYSVDTALKLYEPEGDSIIFIYAEGRKAKKNPSQIKKMMVNELIKQLPSAIKNNSLMHVGSRKGFSVFDVSIQRLKPFSKLDEFEEQAKKFQECRVLFRFLGRCDGEKEALHFEIKLETAD